MLTSLFQEGISHAMGFLTLEDIARASSASKYLRSCAGEAFIEILRKNYESKDCGTPIQDEIKLSVIPTEMSEILYAIRERFTCEICQKVTHRGIPLLGTDCIDQAWCCTPCAIKHCWCCDDCGYPSLKHFIAVRATCIDGDWPIGEMKKYCGFNLLCGGENSQERQRPPEDVSVFEEPAIEGGWASEDPPDDVVFMSPYQELRMVIGKLRLQTLLGIQPVVPQSQITAPPVPALV